MCEECDQKIHNKGARKKHKRFPKNKLEPFFLMTRSHEECNDSIPTSAINQPLFSILENETNNSGEHEIEVDNLDSSSETYTNATVNPLTLQDASLPKAISKNNTSLSLNSAKMFIPQDKRGQNPLYNRNYLSQPSALKTSQSVQFNENLAGSITKDKSLRNKSDSQLNSNRSFTSFGQNFYYSPFNTITITCVNTNIDTSVYCTKKQQVVIPVYQPFVKVDRKFPAKIEEQVINIQKILRVAAEEGTLMIENKELLKLIDDNSQLIKICEDHGVIHTTHRKFDNKKQVFHSLNLDLISHESILWCLKSLKHDEMTPNEKAVQSRIKEAF